LVCREEEKEFGEKGKTKGFFTEHHVCRLLACATCRRKKREEEKGEKKKFKGGGKGEEGPIWSFLPLLSSGCEKKK